MQFKNIVGQHHLKNKLIQTVKNGRISHTQLFLGAEGVGALPLAVAYAQYINCPHTTDEDSCGTCASCVKFTKLVHPDLHFTFPTIAIEKKKLSNEFITQWREAFIANPYLSELDWILNLDSEGKKQGNITAEECRDIIRKLGLKPYEAKYKTVIIWLPEYMRTEGNILLKLLEEPPAQTLIILVAQDANKVIATILSRAQTMRIPRLQEQEITQYLIEKFDATPDIAEAIAGISEGSVVQATDLLKAGHTNYFEMFVIWMRLCYNSRKEIEGLTAWVEKAATEGRESLKSYLTYAQHMLRAGLIYKFGDPKLLRLNEQENAFIQRFSTSLTETNISPIVQELNRCAMQLERNADLKITFLNLSLYIGRLLDKPKTN